jgi:hypothetical protein
MFSIGHDIPTHLVCLGSMWSIYGPRSAANPSAALHVCTTFRIYELGASMTDFRFLVRTFDTVRPRSIGSSNFYPGAWSTSCSRLIRAVDRLPSRWRSLEVRQELRPCAPCLCPLGQKLNEPSGRTEDSTEISNAGWRFDDESYTPSFYVPSCWLSTSSPGHAGGRPCWTVRRWA